MRLALLQKGRLLAYWQRYSQDRDTRLSDKAGRDEVLRLVAWLDSQRELAKEIPAILPSAVPTVSEPATDRSVRRKSVKSPQIAPLPAAGRERSKRRQNAA